MLGIVKSKADQHGRFTPESIWTAWKERSSPTTWHRRSRPAAVLTRPDPLAALQGRASLSNRSAHAGRVTSRRPHSAPQPARPQFGGKPLSARSLAGSLPRKLIVDTQAPPS